MSCDSSRRLFLRLSAISALSITSTGCGTIFYPERRGQPAGRLDWKVIAFDALGLLFFFIPGVVAFAVDFATGAIYLPPDYYYGGTAPHPGKTEFTKINVPHGQLDQRGIESVVSKHSGRDVQLTDGEYQTQPLETLDDFWPAHDALADPSNSNG